MINLISNKAINNFLSILRNKETPSNDFRNALNIISMGLAFEISNTINSKQIKITTPIEQATCDVYDEELILLPILRSGLGMLNSFTTIFPSAKIEYQALSKTENNYEISGLYSSYGAINPKAKIIILEPMIATGNTLCTAIDSLRMNGAQEIVIASIISAPAGVEKVITQFPEINIYSCALDEELTYNSFISPGLGDVGNRINGTI